MITLVNWSNDDLILKEDFADSITAINADYFPSVEDLPYAYSEYDAKVNAALFFVRAMVPYVYDIEEYWQLPLETLPKMGGDCEDGTILFVSLLMSVNYPVRFGAYLNPVKNEGHSFVFVQVSESWFNIYIITTNLFVSPLHAFLRVLF